MCLNSIDDTSWIPHATGWSWQWMRLVAGEAADVSGGGHFATGPPMSTVKFPDDLEYGGFTINKWRFNRVFMGFNVFSMVIEWSSNGIPPKWLVYKGKSHVSG